MRAPRHILRVALAAALAALLILPGQALAEYYVPPGNSAATQYTESFPGAGGEKSGKHKQATPAQTLGSKNAKWLEQHGPAGKAAAEVAAETAPTQVVGTAPSSSGDAAGTSGNASGGGGNKGGVLTGGGGQGAAGQGAAGSGGGSGASDRSSTHPGASSGGGSGAAQGIAQAQPEGSSALGQIAGQATGASDGNLRLWLPLAIVLTLAGSIAYRARMRHGRAV